MGGRVPLAGLGVLFLALLISRLCHTGILWAEETLPLAAAIQILHGRTLYLETWFDKPPLVTALYLLWGAHTGWILRVAGALYCFAACLLMYRFGASLWGRREGLLSAWLLGFFLIFGIPAAVLPLAADLLTIVPHIAAIYLAWRGDAFRSGVAGGVAFLFNAKAAFVVAACLLFVPRMPLRLLSGFALPNAIALGALAVSGALPPYYQQVWEWGMLYSRHTFVDRPLWNGVFRTANWLGFHAALAIGSLIYFSRSHDPKRWRFAAWIALSAIAVTTGWRFFPRYYFQLLPPLALLAARGFFVLQPSGSRFFKFLVLALLLIVPLVRFGPRYAQLARDLIAGETHAWKDIAMDRDSRAAAAVLSRHARPGDTLFVWGYRPDVYAYSRMPAESRFLESQPLTGVFADRHLGQSLALKPELTRKHRAELATTAPALLVDGLAMYNPELAITAYPDLTEWLTAYEEIARTNGSVIYRRRRG